MHFSAVPAGYARCTPVIRICLREACWMLTKQECAQEVCGFRTSLEREKQILCGKSAEYRSTGCYTVLDWHPMIFRAPLSGCPAEIKEVKLMLRQNIGCTLCALCKSGRCGEYRRSDRSSARRGTWMLPARQLIRYRQCCDRQLHKYQSVIKHNGDENDESDWNGRI